mgnify:CR=1 FL=1
MVTLILSNIINISDYQKILAVITLIIDIISSVILLWRVIKSKKISDKELKEIVKNGNLNKKSLLKVITEIILRLENTEEVPKDNEQKEAAERQENEVNEE